MQHHKQFWFLYQLSVSEPVCTGEAWVLCKLIKAALLSVLPCSFCHYRNSHTYTYCFHTVCSLQSSLPWTQWKTGKGWEREDNPESSKSYSTQDRQDNWLKYLTILDLNKHVTIKGKNTEMKADRWIKKKIVVCMNGKLDASWQQITPTLSMLQSILTISCCISLCELPQLL